MVPEKSLKPGPSALLEQINIQKSLTYLGYFLWKIKGCKVIWYKVKAWHFHIHFNFYDWSEIDLLKMYDIWLQVLAKSAGMEDVLWEFCKAALWMHPHTPYCPSIILNLCHIKALRHYDLDGKLEEPRNQ